MVRDTRSIVLNMRREVAAMISSAKNITFASIIAGIISGVTGAAWHNDIQSKALLDEFIDYVKNDLLDDVLEAKER